jgi:hypothetical protein
MDVPSAEDLLPGGTERLVRLVLGDEMAEHLNRKHPGRISVYCDAVRFGDPRVWWTHGSIRLTLEGDADVHSSAYRACPLGVRVH